MNVERQVSPPDPLMLANPPSPSPRCVGRNRHAGPSDCEWMKPPTDSSEETALAATASDLRRLQRLLIELRVNYGHASASQMEKLIAQIPDVKH